jgi:hypothetical protein
MAIREEAAKWGWGLLGAMPVVGLFILASRSSGWLSTLAWGGGFACVALLFVAQTICEVRAWGELEDEFDQRDQETRDAGDR